MAPVYVFDASTAILLAKVTVLRTIANYWKIIITPVVREEIFKKKDSEDTQIIQTLLSEKIIQEVPATNSSAFAKKFGLGEGEAQAIQVAGEQKYILATDDWRAIKSAKIVGVRFVTAIHCLLYLYKNKKIQAEMALEKLKNLEKYGRYNPEIIKNATKIIKGD